MSKRLDVEWLPNEPIWAGPVVAFGATTQQSVSYYRLSADVLHWLESAVIALESAIITGTRPREQLDEYMRVMRVVWVFAAAHLDAEAVKRAKGRAPSLPETVPLFSE